MYIQLYIFNAHSQYILTDIGDDHLSMATLNTYSSMAVMITYRWRCGFTAGVQQKHLCTIASCIQIYKKHPTNILHQFKDYLSPSLDKTKLVNQ